MPQHPTPAPAPRPLPDTSPDTAGIPRARTAPPAPAPAPAAAPAPAGGCGGRRPAGGDTGRIRATTVPGQTRPAGRTTTAAARRGHPGGLPRRALPVHTAFAERLVAVLSGERPVHSMLGLTVGEAYEQLVRLAPRTVARALGPRPVLRRCAAQPHSGDTVLEVFASLAAGPRVRALAFRLELGHDHRWRCAAVELDGLGRLVGGGPQP
ncbi:Rv3235 family protein [Streptomyces hydrogenans]|uniref:Rv3235 family protein n=1 Tax=Streptomyces hydrogenans TaxID=1873719 RepID=UPI0034167094